MGRTQQMRNSGNHWGSTVCVGDAGQRPPARSALQKKAGIIMGRRPHGKDSASQRSRSRGRHKTGGRSASSECTWCRRPWTTANPIAEWSGEHLSRKRSGGARCDVCIMVHKNHYQSYGAKRWASSSGSTPSTSPTCKCWTFGRTGKQQASATPNGSDGRQQRDDPQA